MSASAYVHDDDQAPTTVSEIRRISDLVVPTEFLGLYAYATQSGYASFSMQLGAAFWEHTPTKWIFGFDYGRTQPQAIRSIMQRANTEVRVADGAWIVDREGFLPRRDFHAKLSVMLNPTEARFGMVVGSGNFSANGLRSSVEAGAAFYAVGHDEYSAGMARSVQVAQALWDEATPVEEVLDDYEERWRSSFWRGGVEDGEVAVGEMADQANVFWIEAGYVTKNRGEYRPGNQIDFPRGMSRYFGFAAPDHLPINSVIGAITFQPPIGDAVTKNLRFGNNHMEKITLPTPEAHGFDIYDGKVLVFERANGLFIMSALEVADFESAFGDRLSSVNTMASGRRYGHIG